MNEIVKVNNALVSICEQWALTQLRCLPGSSLLTHMTAIEKIHSRAWHLSLAAVRAQSGHRCYSQPWNPPGREKANKNRNATSKQGVKGRHKIPFNCQHTGTDPFWLYLHGDIETAIKLVILMCGVFAFDVGKSAFARESQKIRGMGM